MAMSEYAILPGHHAVVMRIIGNIPGRFGVYALRAFNLYLRRRNSYLVKTKRDFVIVCSPRELIQVCVMQFGHWEPNVSAVIEGLIRPGSCAADVGANVGYHTLLMSNAVGPRGRVFSFEALAQTFQALQKNLALNGVGNVRTACVAISDKAGTVTIYQGTKSNCGNASIVHTEGRVVGGSVPALPLHEALTEDELSQLQGALRAYQNNKPMSCSQGQIYRI
jgi:FkbM family methyltransferase